jgi:hypothetical protein
LSPSHSPESHFRYFFVPRALWPTGQLLDFLSIFWVCYFLSFLVTRILPYVIYHLDHHNSLLAAPLASEFKSHDHQYTFHKITGESFIKADCASSPTGNSATY